MSIERCERLFEIRARIDQITFLLLDQPERVCCMQMLWIGPGKTQRFDRNRLGLLQSTSQSLRFGKDEQASDPTFADVSLQKPVGQWDRALPVAHCAVSARGFDPGFLVIPVRGLGKESLECRDGRARQLVARLGIDRKSLMREKGLEHAAHEKGVACFGLADEASQTVVRQHSRSLKLLSSFEQKPRELAEDFCTTERVDWKVKSLLQDINRFVIPARVSQQTGELTEIKSVA